MVNPNDLPVDSTEVLRYLGYTPGKKKIKSKILRLVDEEIKKSRNLVIPRGMYRITGASPLKGHELFHDAEKAVFGICTIGGKLEEEVRRLFDAGNATRGVILDAVGTVCTEATADILEEEIKQRALSEGLNCTRRFSPGYGGWNVREQKLVFEYLGKFTAGVKLTPSGIMMPVKSVSFACKLSRGELEEVNKGSSCASCEAREKCLYKSGSSVCVKTAKEA